MQKKKKDNFVREIVKSIMSRPPLFKRLKTDFTDVKRNWKLSIITTHILRSTNKQSWDFYSEVTEDNTSVSIEPRKTRITIKLENNGNFKK